MPDANPDDTQLKLERPSKVPTPFTPGADRFEGKEIDFTGLAPHAEAEPEIENGIDLRGKTKILFAAGRGKTGKTTLLRWIAEMSEARKSQTILADIDPSNASFSRYFNDVARPATDHPASVARWLQQLIEHCITHRQSAIVDLGGGDTTLRTLAGEMPDLGAYIEAAGLVPVMLYLLGTQPEDLTPAVTLHGRGFTTKAQALALNEFAIDQGLTRSEAFDRITRVESFVKLAKSSVRVWMPRLFAAEAIESRQCRFFEARDGKVVPPLGIFDGARLRAWLNTMDRRFAGIMSWIP
jgi:hypothetical protein